MADSTNTISIAVVDAVAPEIAPKLIAIADASDKAAASVGTLTDQMATLKGSGIGTLGTLLSKLESGTLKAAVAQTTLATELRAATAAATQQATALSVNATALTSTTTAAVKAAGATVGVTAASNAATNATKGMVSANISAAAGLGILEGRTLSMNRAAANFITRILGLGPILQQAFVVIGAVAMVAVLGQMAAALIKVYNEAKNAGREIAKAFEESITSMRRSNDELALTNDKLVEHIEILQHRPATNGAAIALDEARVMADKLDESLDNVGKKLNEVLGRNQISEFGGLITGQKSTSEASDYIKKEWDRLSQAAETSAQKDLETTGAAAYKNAAARNAALDASFTRGMQMRADAIKTFQAEMKTAAGPRDLHGAPDTYHLNSDTVMKARAPEIAEYSGAIGMADQALSKLNLTISNMKFNKIQDGLKDTSSGVSAATKQAAKDWKALEAAYVSWETTQEKGGHKPTAQDSLSWLQSQKNNPDNADKLTAKELPFQSKITDDAKWVSDQGQRLQNQVNEIGRYSDALKEESMLKTITQEADQKSIKLTDQQTDSLKQQIATIVENKNYQKQLEDVYKSVNEAKDLYAAKTKALSTTLKDGVLTQAQYDQGITRTIKTYREATDAAAAFEAKLKQARDDAHYKLGSQRDIAVNTELQEYATQLRTKGDAHHPDGYNPIQIAAMVEAKRQEITADNLKNEIDQATNKLIFEQTNLYDQLIVREKALDAAVQAGTMSQEAANAAKLQDWNQQNDLQLKSGKGGSVIGGVLADYAKASEGVNMDIKDAFSATFKTLADGFADTIGKAIVGAKNLGAALKDVAKSAISELISALIKLAIEYYIINQLQKKFHITPPPVVAGPSAKQAAEGIGGMAAITVAGLVMTKLLIKPMWSLAAALAGVTFGISAAAGAASIAALGTAETTAQNHADGGFITGPGTGRSDSIPAYLSNGEYVVNASATSQHRDMLDAINEGSSRETISTKFAPQINASSNGTPRSQMKVEVHNYNGSKVETQQMDENTVRLIVRDEAPSLVAKHAPPVIASQLNNPNSSVSKGISNNTFATRRR